jgi:methionyl-tRNA synthetase
MKNRRKIIATSALIYANGPIHLGHLVEYIQTDIWNRFQKLQGHESYYICGSDAHGTPIMLRAEKEGITPKALVEKVFAEHQQDFSDFHIEFDSFCNTDTELNKRRVCKIYEKLKANGDISTKIVRQFYDEEKQMFLPDRFVKGDCPRCAAKEQYGDNCESCGATYTPTDLKNPYSTVSGSAPVEKESEHYFFALPHYQDFLSEWANSGHIKTSVKNKLDEWFSAGLQDWDISRDAPYFGFEIPDAPGKYFYVWLDAPVGYMSNFEEYCKTNNDISFDEFWAADSSTELHHFVGKDIMYFHTLFWPAMLKGANYRTPTAVHTHGFLTVGGQKMSKSRGTFIKGRTYLDHLPAEFLRYYYATKLGDTAEDIDLNFTDFRLRINSDLIGKYINIASRCAGFIYKKFDANLAGEITEPELFNQFVEQANVIANHYEQRDYKRAMRDIMALADSANQYIAEKEPWRLAKDEATLPQVHGICSLALNLFRLLTLYLKPVLPELAKKVEAFLNIEPLTWQDATTPLLNHKINKFKPLMQRIDEETTTALQVAAQNNND